MEQSSQKESPISGNTSSRTTGTALGALEEAPDPLITAPPELRLRNAIPEPQANNCQQASQSAQQAQQSAAQAAQQASQQVQQASQQAQQSIQQAQQQASQAASQASASASRAITDAQNSANQSIAAATRSASAALASASSLVASVQSSASQAIESAQQRMSQAQASQSLAQSQASSAVLQAGAAVAAATGSAAAAGSSFLAAAALATQSADASVSAIGAQASSQIQQAGVQVTASQVQAVTATQAAIAIVGSVIASALITILIYFLIVRKKRKRREAKNGRSRAQSDTRRDMPSPRTMTGYTGDTKFPTSDQDGATIVATPSNTDTDVSRSSDNSFSLFPKQTSGDNPAIKSTTVPWNPSKPPKAPRLKSWLNVQEVSPFGPIKLPTDDKSSKGPMGGQLKSPLRKFDNTTGPKSPFRLAMEKPVIAPEIAKAVQMQPKKPVQIVQRNVSKLSKSATPENISRESTPKQEPEPVVMIPEEKEPPQEKVKTPQREPNPPIHAPDEIRVSYRDLVRESRASIWTDETPYESPFTPPAAPIGPASVTKGYQMQLPPPRGPVRNTAEWFAAQTRNSTVSRDGGAGGAGDLNKGIDVRNNKDSIANRASQFPPGGRRDTQAMGRMGLPSGPGPRGRAYSMKANTKPEMGQFGQMNDEFDLGMMRNGGGGYTSNRSTIYTPGVGKAL